MTPKSTYLAEVCLWTAQPGFESFSEHEWTVGTFDRLTFAAAIQARGDGGCLASDRRDRDLGQHG